MTRGWMETISLLGLDVVLAVSLALLALDRLSARVREALSRPASSQERPGRDDRVLTGPTPAEAPCSP